MAKVPEGSARWTVADWLNFLRGCIDADIEGLGGYIVRQGDLLPGKLQEAAETIERLRDENEALRHSILHPVAVVVQPHEARSDST